VVGEVEGHLRPDIVGDLLRSFVLLGRMISRMPAR
jgi:hypothetical protein